jgi:hypothetical protein
MSITSGRKSRRALALLVAGAGFAAFVVSPASAASDRTEVTRGREGAEVRVHRGADGGCDGSSMDIVSGRVDDPAPGRATTVEVAVDDHCNVKITKQESKADTQGDERAPLSSVTISSDDKGAPASAEAASTTFEANAVYGNYIRGVQVLQDVVNIDIAKWKWTNDRVWDDVYGVTRFKATGECCNVWWGQGTTSVSWNHAIAANYLGAQTAWTGGTAFSHGRGDFHSDFLWCNFQPGQNFEMTTQLLSYPAGGYDVNFSQNAVCSGTHMSTTKSTSTSQPPF